MGPLPVFGGRVLGLFLCAPDLDLPEAQPAPGDARGGATASGRPPPPASSAYTPQIASGLEGSVSTVEDLDPAAQLIIDGPLFQGWSWKVALRCTPVCTRPQD